MNIRQLFADEEAVSPVIGVILMVAITVILAAVIGTFVLGLGENVNDSAPQANFQFDYDTANTNVDVTHNGGENVDSGQVEITDGTTSEGYDSANSFSTWTDGISTGDTETFGYDGSADTVRVIWYNPSGGSSNVIGESQIP